MTALDQVVSRRNKEVPIPVAAHCKCGQLSECVGDFRYYTEKFEMYSYTVHCGRCGTVTVKCRPK